MSTDDRPHRRRPRYSGTHPRRFEERYKELAPEAWPEMQEHVRAQGRTPAGTHVPVMLAEVLEALDPRPGEVVVDGTLGHGGHTLAFLDRVGPTGRVCGLDADQAELDRTAARIGQERPGAPFRAVHSHFAGIGKVMGAEGLEGFDLVFADLGVSSMQIDDPRRGFSYKHEGPLDMRMDRRLPRTAADLLARLSAEELAAILEDYGDEPHHVRIARRIVEERARAPLATTRQLVRLIFEARRLTKEEWKATVASDPRALHPAARTFQALRIAVNDEMGQLEHLLRLAPWCLKPGGRIGILSFHRGEDRRVRGAFESGFDDGLYDRIGDGPVRPSAAERRDNPRSASALLRWARRAAAPPEAAG
jgi:16S rRNA (cytosine1402-N4)-methyltransferase